MDVSEKLPTYPSPKPTFTLTSHLGQSVGLGEGYGSFPETYNDPIRTRFCRKMFPAKYLWFGNKAKPMTSQGYIHGHIFPMLTATLFS